MGDQMQQCYIGASHVVHTIVGIQSTKVSTSHELMKVWKAHDAMPQSPVIPKNYILFLMSMGIDVFWRKYWPHYPTSVRL
jgi:hypothetical protein